MIRPRAEGIPSLPWAAGLFRPIKHESESAMSKKSERETAKQEAIRRLRDILKPGDRVYGIVRTVSRSGMSRTIDFYTFGPRVKGNGTPDGIDRIYLSGYIAEACDYSRTNAGALRVGGCGMDMIFSVVYHLGRVLFPKGFGLPSETESYPGGIRRPAGFRPLTREHATAMLANGGTFSGRNRDRSGWDDDGGYALKHEQL